MKIIDQIRSLFDYKKNHVIKRGGLTYVPDWEIERQKFGETIFLNIAQILTDIFAEVNWQVADTAKARAFKAWVESNAQRVALELFRGRGYVVVGMNMLELPDGGVEWLFYQLPKSKYTVGENENCDTIVRCYDSEQMFYVLQSPTFAQCGMSDFALCKGFIRLIDAALNGAMTTSERLGAYVVLSPETNDFGGVMVESEKKELEKELQEEYGALSKQKQMLLLSRPMRSEVVSLAGVDLRMQEKVKAGVLGIADRLKVPANQIAFIDANSSKSLSNGTELREGDLAKYRSFRRFVDSTFYKMAEDLGIRADYSMENEPLTTQGQKIQQNGEN